MAGQLPASKLLEVYHLPGGLLPNTVTGYTLNEDGGFEVYLSKETYVTFGEGKNSEYVCYAKVIKGVIKDLQLTGMKGVTTKQFLLWLPVKSIIRSSPDAEFLTFYSGPVGLNLPVKWFEGNAVY